MIVPSTSASFLQMVLTDRSERTAYRNAPGGLSLSRHASHCSTQLHVFKQYLCNLKLHRDRALHDISEFPCRSHTTHRLCHPEPVRELFLSARLCRSTMPFRETSFALFPQRIVIFSCHTHRADEKEHRNRKCLGGSNGGAHGGVRSVRPGRRGNLSFLRVGARRAVLTQLLAPRGRGLPSHDGFRSCLDCSNTLVLCGRERM